MTTLYTPYEVPGPTAARRRNPFIVALGIALIALVALAPAIVRAQTVGDVDATTVTLRAAAVTTNADVPSDCISLSGRDVAVVAPCWVTLGSATNVLISPGGSLIGTTATTYLAYNPSKTVTLTTSGAYLLRIPKEDFGAAPATAGGVRYGYFNVKCTGSPTGTSVLIQARKETF